MTSLRSGIKLGLMKKLLGILVLGLLLSGCSKEDYDIKMCLTSFKLSPSDCAKRIAECKKLWLSEKKCSQKIRTDQFNEMKKKSEEMGKKILENMSEEQKEELGKKLQELNEGRKGSEKKLEKMLEEKKKKEESDSTGR